MAWDPGLLRKYSTTGHFRLLNQLRSELRANPMQRTTPLSKGDQRAESRPQVRAVEVKPRSGGTTGRYRRPLQSAGPKNARRSPAEDEQAQNNASFRDRLSAVDMR